MQYQDNLFVPIVNMSRNKRIQGPRDEEISSLQKSNNGDFLESKDNSFVRRNKTPEFSFMKNHDNISNTRDTEGKGISSFAWEKEPVSENPPSNKKEFDLACYLNTLALNWSTRGKAGPAIEEFSFPSERKDRMGSQSKGGKGKKDFLEIDREENEECLLRKRGRGRPKKSPLKIEVETFPKPIASKIEDTLHFMSQNSHVYVSDSEDQELRLEVEEVSSQPATIFQENCGMRKISETDSKKSPCSLRLGYLIDTIKSEQIKHNSKKFICKFCGKAFEKASSLGGHTAKVHEGLSLTYKNRLNAAKNRKTERNRNQFIKKTIADSLETNCKISQKIE
jgi:hypothetical protein